MCFVTLPRRGHLASAIRLSAPLAPCGQEKQTLLPNYAVKIPTRDLGSARGTEMRLFHLRNNTSSRGNCLSRFI